MEDDIDFYLGIPGYRLNFQLEQLERIKELILQQETLSFDDVMILQIIDEALNNFD